MLVPDECVMLKWSECEGATFFGVQNSFWEMQLSAKVVLILVYIFFWETKLCFGTQKTFWDTEAFCGKQKTFFGGYKTKFWCTKNLFRETKIFKKKKKKKKKAKIFF